MSKEYKVGDKVTAVGPFTAGLYLKPDIVYTISKVDNQRSSVTYYQVEGISATHNYLGDRFEPAYPFKAGDIVKINEGGWGLSDKYWGDIMEVVERTGSGSSKRQGSYTLKDSLGKPHREVWGEGFTLYTEDYQVTEEQEAVLRLLRASLCGEKLKFSGHDKKTTDLCRLAVRINDYVSEVANGKYTIVPKVNPEISRIEAEMRKLADELKALK